MAQAVSHWFLTAEAQVQAQVSSCWIYGRQSGTGKYLNVGNYRFEKVTEFKYLGTTIFCDNNLDIEIHHRLLLVNRYYHGLKKQIKSHYISIKMKCKLYKTPIRPVLLYGCETWAINRYNEERWLERIEDLRNIRVGIWKRMAMDRDKWRIITGAVKAGTQL
jgi:hypothetical protein